MAVDVRFDIREPSRYLRITGMRCFNLQGERKATRAVLIFLVCSVLPSIISYLYSIHLSHKLGIPLFDSFPWGDSAGRYTDFINYRERFSRLHTQGFIASTGYFWAWYPFVYPMFAAVFCAGIFAFGSHAIAAYLISTAGGFAITWTVFAMKVGSLLRSRTRFYLLVAVTAATSFPILFLLLRGNIEGYGVLLVSAAAWCFYRKRWTTCAVFIGMAAAFKLFPIILVALLFSDKKYRDAIIAVLTFVLLELASAAFVGPSISGAIAGMMNGLAFFKRKFELTALAFQFDHSLFSTWKMIAKLTHRHTAEVPPQLLLAYLATAAIAGLLLYFFRLRKLPRTNQLTALIALSILLPPVSFVYTITHMYVVLAALVLFLLRGEPNLVATRSLTAAIACIGLACANLEFLELHGVGLGGQVQSYCLVAVVVLASVYRWQESARDANLAAT